MSDGLRSWKSNGRSSNENQATGMTGQSSARTTWCMPIVYHSTMSVSAIERLPLVHFGSPSPGWLSVGYTPAA